MSHDVRRAEGTRAFFRDVLRFPSVDDGSRDHNWPSYDDVRLYEPRHQTAYGL